MFEVKVHATGSDGNCLSISNGRITILVDVGLPKTKVEKIILAAGIDPTKIHSIYVTHEHQDHARGLAFADKYKIPVYASEGTLKALERLDSGRIMYHGKSLCFDAFDLEKHMFVTAFNVSHDAYEPLGFVVQGKDCKVSVMMDTGCVTDEMLHYMANSDIYVFECNHDIDMVVNGEYPAATKSRILADTGHLSNDAAAEALAKLIKGRGEQILLTHMSSNNNMPAIAEGTVKRALRAQGFKAGEHYHLEVQ
ncbi:MBL fold metallo-hydrolase [Paenibacillus sp. JDR-2]|uniref:MBL fold metallo-hydrolase n=1 Tax=Paenibacillus sp. (strain JDR-2) TaxID=324057 RepID=UPI000166A53E|nr:MBL fold metallo-hydrolase [Paenibacillus sp. JDR-2]ACT00259.1 beta-lactamase domain protein [Paenibacillus sp. JDR-2]